MNRSFLNGVKVIPKGESRAICSSYKPLLLLCKIVKIIAEKLMHKRLYNGIVLEILLT